jgi:LacI family transcriptional regulator
VRRTLFQAAEFTALEYLGARRVHAPIARNRRSTGGNAAAAVSQHDSRPTCEHDVNVYIAAGAAGVGLGVTVKDVAKAAGVSVASVSRALNGHKNMAEDTRERILQCAARMRYMPNGAARSLITRRTHTIGAVLPDLHGEFFSELIRGMDSAARAHGLHLLVSSSHGSASEAGDVLRALRGRVDGLLIMSPHADADMLADNLPSGLPTVLMNTRASGGTYRSISIDNYGGASAMTRHLIARGHQRIAFITGPSNNFDADERLRGYRDVLAELLPGEVEMVLPGDFSEESGYRAGKDIRAHGDLPQAIFAANDMMAIGCLFALGEQGIDVPGAVALAGFDDIPIARFVTPPLTTVRVRIADLGRCALEELATQIEQPTVEAPLPSSLSCEIIVRRSSG